MESPAELYQRLAAEDLTTVEPELRRLTLEHAALERALEEAHCLHEAAGKRMSELKEQIFQHSKLIDHAHQAYRDACKRSLDRALPQSGTGEEVARAGEFRADDPGGVR